MLNESSQHLEEALRWQAFFKQHYAGRKFPRYSSQDGVILSQVASCTIWAILSVQFEKTRSTTSRREKYTICKEVAHILTEHISPVLAVTTHHTQLSYQKLLDIINSYYLIPLKDEIVRKESLIKGKEGHDALWDDLTQAYAMNDFCHETVMVPLCAIYTKHFCCDKAQLLEQFWSDDEDAIEAAILTTETNIFDRQHFYIWSQTPNACRHAQDLVTSISEGLEQLVSENPSKWMPIQERFLAKRDAVEFLKPPHKTGASAKRKSHKKHS